MNSSIPGSIKLLIYNLPAQKPHRGRFHINNFTLNTITHLNDTRHKGSVSYNYRVCTCILFPRFLLMGLIRVAYAQRGPLISVALPLYIAKTEQRLCTEILVKVTLQFSLLFGTHSNAEVKYMDIKGKLYTYSLVIHVSKQRPRADV